MGFCEYENEQSADIRGEEFIFFLSLWFRVSQFHITINQQDAAVRSQFCFTAALLYMFRVLPTPIIRSTSTVSTSSGTGNTSMQLQRGRVREFKLGHVGGR